jgi:predicted AlkP superfamily pyrophosphatase or phosphodiesterase
MPARRIAVSIAFAALAPSCAGAVDLPDPTPARPRAIIVSIDGLMPDAYTSPDRRGLAVPTLRAMVAGGAWATSARSVMPSVTYPAHTTIATGVPPALHGIAGNRAVDPLERNQSGWHWYSEEIRVPTLWQVVEGAGRSAALINWPVTVGARARFVVPEFWRAGTADDQRLLRALSTPGLLERVEARFPDLWQKLTPPDVADAASIDVAVHLIETSRPDLVMVHIWMVDEMQHRHGPWSAQARAAIEEADRQLARLVAACRRSRTWDETALFVVSDHGFAASHTLVKLGALLRERGLIRVDAAGKPTEWRAAVQSNGGTAYVYLADPGDRAAAAELRAALASIAAGPDAVLRRVLEPEDLRRLGGDPGAALAVEAADGFSFADGVDGPWRQPASSVGQHGYGPDRDAMQASFLAYGPGVRRAALGQVDLEDVAPTVAAWLGVALERARGRAIDMRGR